MRTRAFGLALLILASSCGGGGGGGGDGADLAEQGGTLTIGDTTIVARSYALVGGVSVELRRVPLPAPLPAGFQPVGNAFDVRVTPADRIDRRPIDPEDAL